MIVREKIMTKSAGLVIIHNNKILAVHPSGQKWYGTYSIPKGHIEEGEDELEAAIRETREETGIEFNVDQIQVNHKGYIDYKDGLGKIYKKVYYFVIELEEAPIINKKKIQREEVDWVGFLTKEEAEKRIFWRFKPILKYLV